MPIMDGLKFVKQLSGVSNAKGVPVVMITTEGSESHVRRTGDLKGKQQG
jgi:two-component system chemotaxis response regulator CheY